METEALNTVFPAGFPAPTAFYLIMYVFTMVIHVVFMNYVIAGTGYLALVSIFTGGEAKQRHRTPMAMTLRDWMPFMVSGAITAGVAPLLFIQILYQKPFYTANLLLFNRWMIILPVLIVGFYLLYLLKSKVITNWPVLVRTFVGVLAFVCFAFIAYSWTENYLLSIKTRAFHADFYADQRPARYEAALIPRLGIWFIGSLPTLAMLVLWQLWYKGRQADQPDLDPADTRRAATYAILGWLGAAGFSVTYLVVGDDAVRDGLRSMMALPWVILGGTAVLAELVIWAMLLRKPGIISGKLLWALTAAIVLGIAGMTVGREAVRIAAFDPEMLASLYPLHREAARIGGLSVFLLFFLLNAGLVVWCFVLVRKGWIRDDDAEGGPDDAGSPDAGPVTASPTPAST